MTYRTFLKKHDGPDARTTVLYGTGFDLTELILRMDEEIPDGVLRVLEDAVARTGAGEPLQYVFKKAPFYGFWFDVDERVLIPRFDSEILVNEVLTAIPETGRTDVLDLCAGSGCLGLTIGALRKDARITLSDISGGALEVARKNAEKLGVDASIVKSDLFAAVEGAFDVIVSNPPYIRTGEIETLDENVRAHEPRLALDGGAEGLAFYRRIAKDAGRFLKENGRIFLEIGYDEAESVTALLEKNGFSEIRVVRDLALKDRVVSACYGNSNN